ncbi:nitrous oxide reductase accessory protein NosL [Caenispirillum salinarum]|uniref:nitrous oxide reductase accessory protein NosL n=1 Tax=Caenispirillum salinarum TaxID=859058 RepID=UPI00384D0F7B
MRRWIAIPLLAFALAACDDGTTTADAPPPVEPTRDAITHFGRMILVDHDGPRGQIHLEDGKILWFPAVRDVKAFTLLPEESKDIAAMYVSDMATAQSWEAPDTWMPARDAFYVIGSDARGGMGMPEPVPFSDRSAADAFASERGGDVVMWDDIPDDYILSSPEEGMDMGMNMDHGEGHK